MQTFNNISRIGLLLAALLLTNTSNAQPSVGLGGGLDIESDATLAGLQLRLPILLAVVGMTFEFGKGEVTFESGPERFIEYDILRFTVPIGYAFIFGEFEDISIMPFAAPGWYSWKPVNLSSAVTNVSLDLGVEARYNIFFVNAFVGTQKETPDYGFRLGVLFTIGR